MNKKKSSKKIEADLEKLLSEPRYLSKIDDPDKNPEEFIEWASAAGFNYIVSMVQVSDADNIQVLLDSESMCACTTG